MIVDAIRDPLDLDAKLVVGVATQDFRLGSRVERQQGASCFLSHHGDVFGKNGFDGIGYDIKFGPGDAVMTELDLERQTVRFGKNGRMSRTFACTRLLSRHARGSTALYGLVGLPPGASVSVKPMSYHYSFTS